jgi:hypothetical protein
MYSLHPFYTLFSLPEKLNKLNVDQIYVYKKNIIIYGT